jgi:hypothetical protein
VSIDAGFCRFCGGADYPCKPERLCCPSCLHANDADAIAILVERHASLREEIARLTGDAAWLRSTKDEVTREMDKARAEAARLTKERDRVVIVMALASDALALTARLDDNDERCWCRSLRPDGGHWDSCDKSRIAHSALTELLGNPFGDCPKVDAAFASLPAVQEVKTLRAEVALLKEASRWNAEHTEALEKNWEAVVNALRIQRDALLGACEGLRATAEHIEDCGCECDDEDRVTGLGCPPCQARAAIEKADAAIAAAKEGA